MKSKYLVENYPLPAIDTKITAYVEEKGEDPWGSTDFYIGIIHQGVLYRRLSAEGITELVGCDNFLLDLGLIKQPAAKGYDSLFEVPANLV
ncbi:hypothetical protein [Actinobacillus lignieresii]|uniref:Uncharacterized protein n=1 Tax=Actinobacillus lignieresii TaxID=720 RepID=A0A380TU09_ACTLI|nr:hypothetical protein [Actinobacillus lignieresii]SUT91479.1 Uncharacterised protein [Actinobacillus lignieresii]